MAIPLDIEEIFGSAVADSVRRALAGISCLWLGAATGILGMNAGWAIIELIQGSTIDPEELLGRITISCAFGPLVLFGSIYLPFFFPLVFAAFFIFMRGDGGSTASWVVTACLTGLASLLSVASWLEGGFLTLFTGSVLWLGFAGSLGLLAFLFTAHCRARAAQHLLAIQAENDLRRRELASAFGTACADREFALGEQGIALPEEAQHRSAPRRQPR